MAVCFRYDEPVFVRDLAGVVHCVVYGFYHLDTSLKE